MKKLAIICPSNILYMPYLNNYLNTIKSLSIEYHIYVWDRSNLEVSSERTFRDKKIGHKRNLFDYCKYRSFLLSKLKKDEYDIIIVFGLQLGFFLKGFLIKNYKNRYILDIRDYNKILKVFNPMKLIQNSYFTTISSPRYIEWLPISKKYVLNHNHDLKSVEKIERSRFPNLTNELIKISYIGSLVNLDENIDFINALSNSSRVNIAFYGLGIINDDLKKHIKEKNINNVSIKGKYEQFEEASLYKKTDMVNMILYNKNINDRTCLSNRIYRSCFYGRPLICYDEKTYILDIVKEYKLGLIINDWKDLEHKIVNYINNFNREEYDKNRERFLLKTINDNCLFEQKLIKFCIN